MWMCLSDAGRASFICSLVLDDEVQDGSGENKTAPWRLQSGWGSPVVCTHDKVRTSAWSHKRIARSASFGPLHVEIICVCVCAFKDVRITEAVDSHCTCQQFFEERVWDPFLCWMVTNCNNIVKCESIPGDTYWSISSRRKGTWIGIKWYCKRTCFTEHVAHELQLARQILDTATALDIVQVNITFTSGGVASAGEEELILVVIGAKSERGEHWKCIGEASSTGKTGDHGPPRRTASGITQIPW